jgi:hypothetical protein
MNWSRIAIVGMLCLLGVTYLFEFIEFIGVVRNFFREVRKRPELLVALMIILAIFAIGSALAATNSSALD